LQDKFFSELLGKRPDGYHELRSVMQSISLYDILTVCLRKNPGIILKTNKNITGRPEENLVYRAAQLFLKKYSKQNHGLSIYLRKKIPVAAGLAGGSADCAAILHGLNKVFKLNLTTAELAEIADQLGSDITFCLYGGAMLAEGRGEKVKPLPFVGRWPGIIIKPEFGISTADVYRQVKKIIPEQKKSFICNNFVHGRVALEKLADNLHNDLFPYALNLRPDLLKFIENIKKTVPIAVQMSGSGPSIFAFYLEKRARDRAFRQLKFKEKYKIETVKNGCKVG
jgi:4-diphosphocytidyl-2-C-methyl-D-erythritol kinase